MYNEVSGLHIDMRALNLGGRTFGRHETGVCRELVPRCNLLIGILEQNPAIADSVREYLEKRS